MDTITNTLDSIGDFLENIVNILWTIICNFALIGFGLIALFVIGWIACIVYAIGLVLLRGVGML